MDTDHEWVDWLRGLLKTGADALGAQPADDPVLGLRGRTVDCRVTTGARARWLRVVTAHGDLHWANLTNSGCWILDWESWGTAPAGYDVALLHAVSLPRPETAEQVQCHVRRRPGRPNRCRGPVGRRREAPAARRTRRPP